MSGLWMDRLEFAAESWMKDGMRRFNTSDADFNARFTAFLHESRDSTPDVDATVAGVLGAVKAEGLAAVLRYTAQFDEIELNEVTMRVTAEEIAQGVADCPADAREAIRPRAASATITPASGPQISAGPTRTAWTWAGAGRRWRPLGSMCRAAAQPIPRPC
jgi:histidinol dehydrogenase